MLVLSDLSSPIFFSSNQNVLTSATDLKKCFYELADLCVGHDLCVYLLKQIWMPLLGGSFS